MQNRLKETKSQERLINLMLQAGVEWPGNCSHVAQDKDGEVRGFTCKPGRLSLMNHWSPQVDNGCTTVFHSKDKIPNWHQTIITREQYESRDRWITWHGGGCPVDGDTVYEFERRDGLKYRGSKFNKWEHDYGDADIIAYRIHKEQPEAHDENYALPAEPCESVKACIPDQPTIEQLIAEWKRLDAVDEKSRVAAEIDRAAFDRAAEAVEEALQKAGWH